MPHYDVEGRRLLDKLLRETARAELQAIEHAARESKRLGPVPPVMALAATADHATEMQARLVMMLEAHAIDLQFQRSGIGSTLSSLRHLVVDRMIHAERAYRTILLDLRHGIELVKLLRESTRQRLVFGLIRWCDDWLGARRTLVARVEAQLAWFAQQEQLADLPASARDLEEPLDPSERDHS